MRLFILFLLCPILSLAQVEENDNQATALLERVNSKLQSEEYFEIDFTLEFSTPGIEEESQVGKVNQYKDFYKVELKDQRILGTNSGLYMIFHDTKTIQINDLTDNQTSDVFNPKSIASLYKNEEFLYAITGEEDFNGERMVNVEFKPKDRYSELSKIRVSVEKRDELPAYAKFFNKDGSRITIVFQKFDFDKPKNLGSFEFSKEDYPGYEIEDLRID